MKTILTLLLTTFITLNSFAQKIKFELAPEYNKPKKYESVTKIDMEGPQTMIMDMTMHMDMTYSKLQDSLINITAKFSNAKVDFDAGMMAGSFDSSKEPSNEMEKIFASQFKPLLENNLTYSMNKLGHIIDIDFPNVSEQLFDKSTLSSFGTTYPNHSISIGDSWTKEGKMGQLGINSISTFKFAEKTTEGYKIESTVNLTDASGNNVGNSTGHFIVDPKTFITISSSNETNISLQGMTVKNVTQFKMIK